MYNVHAYIMYVYYNIISNKLLHILIDDGILKPLFLFVYYWDETKNFNKKKKKTEF